MKQIKVTCKRDFIIQGCKGEDYLVRRGSGGIANIEFSRNRVHIKLVKTEKDREINKNSFVQRCFMDIKEFKCMWKLNKIN